VHLQIKFLLRIGGVVAGAQPTILHVRIFVDDAIGLFTAVAVVLSASCGERK
jgi:hypothetical protein